MKIFDKNFYYIHNRRLTFCNLKLIFKSLHNKDFVAVFTELNKNTGASVTNSIEDLVNSFLDRFNLDRSEVVFVERYEQSPDEIHEINFNVKGEPNWNPLTSKEINLLKPYLSTNSNNETINVEKLRSFLVGEIRDRYVSDFANNYGFIFDGKLTTLGKDFLEISK